MPKVLLLLARFQFTHPSPLQHSAEHRSRCLRWHGVEFMGTGQLGGFKKFPQPNDPLHHRRAAGRLEQAATGVCLRALHCHGLRDRSSDPGAVLTSGPHLLQPVVFGHIELVQLAHSQGGPLQDGQQCLLKEICGGQVTAAKRALVRPGGLLFLLRMRSMFFPFLRHVQHDIQESFKPLTQVLCGDLLMTTEIHPESGPRRVQVALPHDQ